MKVLWICNIVLSQFTEAYKIKKNPFGGWMDSLWPMLVDKGIDIEFAFPIYDECRIKNGSYEGINYYSYHGENDLINYDDSISVEFENILNLSKPDIIHIWGTENNHCRAAVDAAIRLGIGNRIIIRMQGIVSEFSNFYLEGIPKDYVDSALDNLNSLDDEIRYFRNHGVNEIYSIKHVKYVSGRSDCDRFFVKRNNPDATYFSNYNVLRKAFYNKNNAWNLNKCKKNSIFVTQGSYPIKGLHYLIRAVSILEKRYADIELIIAGPNLLEEVNSEYSQFIKSLIDECNAADYIHFIGQQDETQMINQYLKCNVSVCPSLYDNYANSVMESMILGVPTISAFVGGNVNIIDNGVDGIMYPCNDAGMLAGYIEMVLSNNELADRLSRNARSKSFKRYRPDAIRDLIIKQYNCILRDGLGA